LICGLACGFVITAQAGIRGPGKYCGVVVFDRWDTCFLLSGPYITYISDRVKNDLRPYKGKAIQVDASEVSQPRNPGDALIRKYKILGPAPENHRWPVTDGVEIVTEGEFDSHGTPTFLIKIRNTRDTVVEIDSSEVGPTLLGSSHTFPFGASDGRSVAWITRGSLVMPFSWNSTSDGVAYSAAYRIEPGGGLPERFDLEPGLSRESRVTLEVSAGQYQFMVGYGGGVHEEKSLASNAISFDLNERGVATLSNPQPSSAW